MSDFAPGVERARAAGYKMTVTAYPEDIEEGIEESLETIGQKVREGRLDPDVRGWAADVLMAAGNPRSVRDRMQALLDAFRKVTTYTPDPKKTEYIVAAAITACLRPGLCVRARDCDDGVVMLASAALTQDIDVELVRQHFGADRQNHVLFEVRDENGQWLAVDAATSFPVGQKVTAVWEERIDPLELVGQRGTSGYELVTVGGLPGVGSAPMETAREVHFDGRCWNERRYGKEWRYEDGVWREKERLVRPAVRGLGDVTSVVDVFTYRRLWDNYVLGMARAAQQCSAAWAAQAAGQTPQTPIATNFVNPPAPADVAQAQQENADRIIEHWNAYAGWSSADILSASDKILQSEQDVVLRCAQFWGPNILRHCPQVTLPDPPTLDLQQQAIAYLEAASVVAKGTLQLVAVGAQGAAQTYTNVAEKVGALGDKLLDNTPYIAGAIVIVAAAYMAFLIVPEIRATRSVARRAA